ncbi:MerR family transcriptional regulator [Sporosalibacterium faouarense]|uniref:MerR family transcriptional regulator n=1 Tax=Sporosalibacterium faouarense TaxID=516123 RepID=UPI00192CB41C|nr:MerR family transcriptional regulator [Sporosalibacterium faouarense]
MFKIGEFSKFTKVSTRMLRYYDEVGLFKPKKIDKFTGYRYYSASQMPELIKIVTLRDVGFTISEISRLIKVRDDQDFIKELKRKQLEIKDTITVEEKKISDIDKIISNLGKEMYTMNYEIIIKEIPSYKVVSVRGIVDSYSNEVNLWEKLGKFAQGSQLQPNGAPFAIYHDGEHKDSNIDIEVVMPVDELQDSKGEFVFREVEAIPTMATILYKGPYENIDEAFYFLANWIEDSKYESYGNARQISIKGAWNEPNPDNYLVEIQIPVRKL